MNTPAHIILGAAVFGRDADRKVLAAAIFGGVLPDLSLYLLAGTSLFLLLIPPERVFGELYFSDAWQTIFAIDNSAILWGVGLGLAIALRKKWAVALCGPALLHVALDFPLHHDDGRAHFWPLSDWVFQSPFSYWDRAHGANWIGPLEALLCVMASVVLWRAHAAWGLRALFAVLLLIELRVVGVWLWQFALG